MIDKEDYEILDARYVLKKDCDSTNDEIRHELSEDRTELALIKQQLNSILWIGKTTLATLLTGIIGAILAMILK